MIKPPERKKNICLSSVLWVILLICIFYMKVIPEKKNQRVWKKGITCGNVFYQQQV
jgi:hypothetical protein